MKSILIIVWFILLVPQSTSAQLTILIDIDNYDRKVNHLLNLRIAITGSNLAQQNVINGILKDIENNREKTRKYEYEKGNSISSTHGNWKYSNAQHSKTQITAGLSAALYGVIVLPVAAAGGIDQASNYFSEIDIVPDEWEVSPAESVLDNLNTGSNVDFKLAYSTGSKVGFLLADLAALGIVNVLLIRGLPDNSAIRNANRMEIHMERRFLAKDMKRLYKEPKQVAGFIIMANLVRSALTDGALINRIIFDGENKDDLEAEMQQ